VNDSRLGRIAALHPPVLLSVFLVALVVLFSASCRQSPLVPFRRAVDQAASWAAAIGYAHELESHRAVPGAYLKQIVKDGAAEIQTVRQTIAKESDLPSDLKNEAITLCDQMIGLLDAGTTEPQNVDVTTLAAIEHKFRALDSRVSGR
jgi:hypothetical protein